ncbi:MAG: hypothetical protein Q4F18_06250 [Clostridia bacterium]|nr:hypothetical protein [Clostridia bacterium]
MLNYTVSEAAAAVAAAHKMTRKDVWDVARFGLGFMLIPVLVTGLYLVAGHI